MMDHSLFILMTSKEKNLTFILKMPTTSDRNQLSSVTGSAAHVLAHTPGARGSWLSVHGQEPRCKAGVRLRCWTLVHPDRFWALRSSHIQPQSLGEGTSYTYVTLFIK